MLKLGKIIAITIVLSWVSEIKANERGPVTNLPIPRFVSMKVNEGFVRSMCHGGRCRAGATRDFGRDARGDRPVLRARP